MTYQSSPSFHIPEQYYAALFEAIAGNSILVKNDAPKFTILAATPEYIINSGYAKKALIGKGVFEAFPANHADPSHKGDQHLYESFQQVLEHKEPHFLPLQRYDLQNDDGSFTKKYWKASNKPVFSPAGDVAYILHTAEDITDQIKAEKREEVHEELLRAFHNVEQSEAALQKFKFMADNAQDPFILMREDGSFAYLNKKAVETWGYTEEEAKGLRVPDVDPIYQDEGFKQVFARAQQGETLQFETLHKRKDGLVYPVEVNMNGITLSGTPHMFAVARNIAERKKAEEDLRESESRFRSMIEQAPVAIALTTGPDFIFESINLPMLEIINKKSEEVVGKNLVEVLPELKGQPLYNILLHVLQSGDTFRGTEVATDLVMHGILRRRYFNISYTRIEEKSGVNSVLHMSVDVTERVMAKHKLEESEARFRLLADASPNLIWMLKPDGSYGYVNKTTLDFLNITQEQIAAVGWSPFQHPDDLEAATTAIAKAVQNQQPYEMEHRLRHKDGEYRWVLSQALPAYDANGDVFAYVGSSIDINEAKMAQRALVESESRFRTMAEHTPVLVAITDETGNGIYFNKAWTNLTGRPMQELLEYGWVDLLHPNDKEYFLKIYLDAFVVKGPFTAEFRVVNSQGEYRWLLAHAAARFNTNTDGNFVGFISACTDITEQKQSEQQLQTALEQVRLSKDAAELGTFDMDLEKGTMHWDDRCRILFGISHQKPVTYERDFVGGLHPEDREPILKVIDRVFIKSVSNGDYDVEYRTVGAEDGVVRWIRAKGKVYFNGLEKPVRFIGSVLDITAQVTTIQKIESLVEERTKQLAQANESLLQANKELQRSNGQLEEFTYAASHDLKEPIRKIAIFSHQLKVQLGDRLKENESRIFGRVLNSTERMGNLVDDLLLYSHVTQRPHETESIDLNQKVRRVLEDLELDIEEKGAIIEVVKLPVVKGYRRQLQQLFQNLIANALKYSKTDVPPRIDISAAEVTEYGKRYHVITIKDNGIGFEQQYAEKIFQMFTRLHGKAEYSGTGVGLSIVKKVVENHNGFIRVESTPGVGSVFMVSLPAD